jgi:cardiolipin synthase A/B
MDRVSTPGVMRRALGETGLACLLLLGGAGCTSFRGHGVRSLPQPVPAVTDPQFARSLGALLDAPLVASNRVTSLLNGDQFFPAMLEAIRGARQSITFESYIYQSGRVSDQFTEALAQRARAGVKIRVLLDSIGSRHLKGRDLDALRAAGADVRMFNRFSLLHPGRLNHRDHRKIVVVDGAIGFIGGAGVGDMWEGNADAPNHWRDAFFRVEGPVVAQLQGIFADNWLKVTGQALAGPVFFPQLAPAGDHPAQAFAGDPRAGDDHVRQMYLMAFAGARQSIRLSLAYFVPCDLTLRELVAAAERGVKVEIIMPGRRTDSEGVRPASRAKWGDLLAAGARLYEYRPTMYHCKGLIVDDVWVSVGSANLDNRSLSVNDEANLNVYSAEFAAEQIRFFEADKLRSREVTYEQWKHRSIWKHLSEWLTLPIRPLL